LGYGVGVQLLAGSLPTLAQVQELGITWVRQPIRWEDVEPQPGNLQWQALDPIFLATSARNIKVLVTVYGAPDWSRSVTAPDLDGPPDDIQAYVAFVSQLVSRYRGAIHAVEIWSEMNREQQWYTAGGISSAGYMQLLIPSAQAIRSIDPGVIVISGGLNPTGLDDGVQAVDDFRYMRQMIDAGLLSYVDCVGAHHKGYNLPPDVAYDEGYADNTALFREPFSNLHHSWSFYSTLRGYNDMIVATGRETPVCVTEFGWASMGGLAEADVPAFVRDNSLQEQADYTVRAFELMDEWGFVWLAFLSNLDYSPEILDSSEGDLTIYYRVVASDGAPRPVYDALRAMPRLP
jgi:hypothetical protein